jgi:DNA-binding transcriptional ArsR family regulator
MKELEQYFKALGDNNRLRIINLLLHGELCVCDIQYVLENSQPKEPIKRILFDFLRQAFEDEEQLQQDTQRLKEAIAAGACTLSEWKPFSALGRPKTSRSSSRETARV